MPEKEGSASVRLAATVMLLRKADDGRPEVFMLKRSERSAFAPAAYVFPGGTLDPQDLLPETMARAVGVQPDRVAAQFRATVPRLLPTTEPSPSPQQAAGLFTAALRELFEEAGILIAADSLGAAIDAERWRAIAPRVPAARERLCKNELTFATLLESLDLYADAQALSLFSHWITPPTERRRYSTYFFVASAPLDQAAFADAAETHDGRWIAPRDALRQHRASGLHLVYPTLKHLERLAEFDDLEELLAYVRTKAIATIMPATSEDGFTLPRELENAW